MKTFIHIPVFGRPKLVEVDEKQELRFLQECVKGSVEAVMVKDHVMYINEEGKLKGLSYNGYATNLASGYLGPFDVIVGDAVLVGPTVDDGDSTSVDDYFVKLLCRN